MQAFDKTFVTVRRALRSGRVTSKSCESRVDNRLRSKSWTIKILGGTETRLWACRGEDVSIASTSSTGLGPDANLATAASNGLVGRPRYDGLGSSSALLLGDIGGLMWMDGCVQGSILLQLAALRLLASTPKRW